MQPQDPPLRLASLTPIAQLRAGRMAERSVRLLAGLWLYGAAIALMIASSAGSAPWDVFHVGLAEHLPLGFGSCVVAASIGVLLVWVPLRQVPGLGTVLNAALVGPFADVNLYLLPEADGVVVRVGYLVAGIVVCAFATALYVGAQLGPGPRDGLMTGLARRSGRSIRLVRTGIEVVVLASGVLLGGAIGVGTLLFALSVGPLTQVFLPWLIVPVEARGRGAAAPPHPTLATRSQP